MSLHPTQKFSALNALVDRAYKISNYSHLHDELEFLENIVIQHGLGLNKIRKTIYRKRNRIVKQDREEDII